MNSTDDDAFDLEIVFVGYAPYETFSYLMLKDSEPPAQGCKGSLQVLHQNIIV